MFLMCFAKKRKRKRRKGAASEHLGLYGFSTRTPLGGKKRERGRGGNGKKGGERIRVAEVEARRDHLMSPKTFPLFDRRKSGSFSEQREEKRTV